MRNKIKNLLSNCGKLLANSIYWKFDTDDMQISFQIIDVILRNFTLFFRFNGSSSRKEDLQMIVLKSEEKNNGKCLW